MTEIDLFEFTTAIGLLITFSMLAAIARGERDETLRDKLEEPLGDHYKETL